MEANSPGDVENINLDDNTRRKTHNNQKIVLSDELAEKLLNGWCVKQKNIIFNLDKIYIL